MNMREYFSKDRMNKIGKFLVEKPVLPYAFLAAAIPVVFLVVMPRYAEKQVYEQIAKPLIELQHERFKKDAAELGIEYNVTLEERLEEHKKYMRERK
jgi:hypothetical protein